MAYRTLIALALAVTRFAPSGSHLYAIHIWLHAWTDKTVFVDGTQRVVVKHRPSATRHLAVSSAA